MTKVYDRRESQVTCDNCAFSRRVQLVETKGKESIISDMCECHISRPTQIGFPIVRRDDFCAFHVNNETLERSYSGLVTQGTQIR